MEKNKDMRDIVKNDYKGEEKQELSIKNKYYEIEINGKKINLNELSDEEIDKLREYLKEERASIRKKIDEYIGLNDNIDE